MGSIIVINSSGQEVSAFVSKYSRNSADDNWFKVAANAHESWTRDGWELVAFKDSNDTHRAGVYVPVNSTVTFHSFTNITHT